MVLWLSDTESDQRANGKPKSDSEKNVTNADHGECSGLVEDVSVRHCLAVSRGDGLGLWSLRNESTVDLALDQALLTQPAQSASESEEVEI